MAIATPVPTRHWRARDLVTPTIAGSTLARRFLQDLLQRLALHARDVVLVFQERAKRVADDLWGERTRVELRERGRPVDRLGNARRFIKVLVAQRLHEAHHLL